MNSFKKIALALAAAMTLGTVASTPASATSLVVAVTTKVAGSGTAADPITVNVPFDNVVSNVGAGTTEALTFTATVAANTPVTFTAVGNARIVAAVGSTVTSTSGSTSLTVTPSDTNAVVYVFTTSTSASAVTTSILGASTTHYIKGVAGPGWTLALSAPASGNIGGTVKATATVKDIFGNPVSVAATTGIVEAAINGSFANLVEVSGTPGTYESLITLPAVAGTAAVSATLGVLPDAVPTLGTATTTATIFVSASDLAAQLAAANAALAAEKAAAATAKAAADKALADANAAATAAALAAAAELTKAKADATAAATKAAADLVTANAEVAKLKAEAVTAKAAADKALADATAAHVAELAKVKADNDAALASMKSAFNKLARQWNKKNPKAKVALVK